MGVEVRTEIIRNRDWLDTHQSEIDEFFTRWSKPAGVDDRPDVVGDFTEQRVGYQIDVEL